ncbi:MATE family efflux transporter [Sphingobium sp. R-21]|uniref:MATE family efflux transporter n=1 Tax=Sphingobium sp. R-21 TaxID=3404056 RepID=UPI003CF7F54E
MKRSYDLTKGSIVATLFYFSLPVLGANIAQSIKSTVNAIWTGRLLGEAALAAMASANEIIFLMFALGFGFAMATAIQIGQKAGAGDMAASRRIFGTGLTLLSLGSTLIAILGWLFTDTLLNSIGTPPEARAFAENYLRIVFLALPPTFSIVLIISALQAIGDTVTPLRFMALDAILDASLSPILMQGLGPLPRMGITGAAIATVIANYAVLTLLITHIYRNDIPIRLRRSELQFLVPNAVFLRSILFKGFPLGLQMLISTLSSLVMIVLINQRGVDVAAAYGTSNLLWSYIQMPVIAIGAGVSAMVAQSIGANNWPRVGQITKSGLLIALFVTCIGTSILLISGKQLSAIILGQNIQTIEIAHHINTISCWSFFFSSFTVILFSTMRANGVVSAPLLILIAGTLVGRFAFAWWLLSVGKDTLWWSFPFGSGMTAVIAWFYYRHGTWRTRTEHTTQSS